MKNISAYACLIYAITNFIFSQTTYGQLSDEKPYEKVKPISETFQPLPFSSIKPKGWLKDEIEKDLNGFTGHLDSLVPSLVIDDDIYDKNRLTAKIKSKDVGAKADAGDWQVQFLWWNSETQSNWRDGYIRSAVLANNKQHLARIEKLHQ